MIRLNELIANRWLLMIWEPPEQNSAMLYSLGFRPTRKNTLNWWRIFEESERKDVKKVCREIAVAGLRSSWRKLPGVLDVCLKVSPARLFHTPSANCGRSPEIDEGRAKSELLT